MPRVVEYPEKLRPYYWFGVQLGAVDSGGQASGDCPFCGKEGKFRVAEETGLWQCKVCLEGSKKGGGNVYTFLNLLHQRAFDGTSAADHNAFAAERLLLPETLVLWQIARCPLTGDWLVPGHNPDGALIQLYRYASMTDGYMRLIAVPTLGHGLIGPHVAHPGREDVYLCEGPWDAMALWETLGALKPDPDSGGYAETANQSSSLLSRANVLAVPGCSSFLTAWADSFAGQRVFLMYDNDYPRTNPKTGRRITPPSWEGMARAAAAMTASSSPPKEILYLQWDSGGEDHDSDLGDGYDVRDALRWETDGREDWGTRLADLFDRLAPVREEWVKEAEAERIRKAAEPTGSEDDCLRCEDWKKLINSWRRAMLWTEGLDRGLSVAMAVVLSTPFVGDQLWVKMIGPAACGKSTLCEGLSMNKKYVLPKSTIRGFHSGWKPRQDGSEGKDNSLIMLAKGKTLVTKDGDTLLQAPNLSQILAEARDVYDRVSRTHYRHGMATDYEGISITWLLCGTESLRHLDDSELGERFLDCVIVDKINEEEEQSTALRVAYRAAREMTCVADGKVETRDGPEMVEAKRLTGGYVGYLRRNAGRLLAEVGESDEALETCVGLGTLVAYMRARPSKRQDEKVQREMNYRLTSQMVRLAKGLAVVLNRPTLDEEVMRRVARVALDTARGKTMDVVKYLATLGDVGATLEAVSLELSVGEDKASTFLIFLTRIGVIEFIQPEAPSQRVLFRAVQKRWRLAPRIRQLYDEAVRTAGLPARKMLPNPIAFKKENV